jgi:hypothetical protein
MNKHTVKKHQHPKRNSTALSRKELFLYGGALAVYLFYQRSLNTIINYPNIILCVPVGIIFVIIFLYRLPRLRKEINAAGSVFGKIIAVSVRVLSAAIFSWFITGILLIPFNYYDIHAAQRNYSETFYCPITGLIADARKNCVYYEFSGSSHIVYGYSKLLNEIYLKGNYREYQLGLTVKKALFGSYSLEDWWLVKR